VAFRVARELVGVGTVDDDVILMQEIFAEDMEVLNDIFRSDFLPLIKHKEQLERREFDRALAEVEKLEREL